MAHEVYQHENGDYSMAFVGNTPWHGLGQKLNPDDPLEVWAEKSHLDWEIGESVGMFYPTTEDRFQKPIEIPKRKILYRKDNNQFLSLVSNQYNIVQPVEVIEFFRDLIESGGFKMSTAGSLFNGQRIWALAEIGRTATIMGQDKIRGYLLLATSCDGSLANTGQFTSVRVVCNNTLEMSINAGEHDESRRYVKIPHSRKFDPNEMKAELGLAYKTFDNFIENARILAQQKIKIDEAVKFFVDLYRTKEEIENGTIDINAAKSYHVKNLLRLYQNENLQSSKETAWGAVNAVTCYYDHKKRAHKIDNRLNNAWFGNGANIKQQAWNKALLLAA